MSLSTAIEVIVWSIRAEDPTAVVGVCIGVDEVQELSEWQDKRYPEPAPERDVPIGLASHVPGDVHRLLAQ